jgi:hypothetical protein
VNSVTARFGSLTIPRESADFQQNWAGKSNSPNCLIAQLRGFPWGYHRNITGLRKSTSRSLFKSFHFNPNLSE